MRRLASSKRSLLIASPFALLFCAVLALVVRTQHTLNHIAPSAHQAAFTLIPYDPAAGAAANPGFELVASPAAFTKGVSLGDDLYLAGPTGLSVFSADGGLQRTLRTGLELPVAPIAALAVGRPRGAAEPELLIATAGAGLLLMTADASLHQLLPASAALRDLTSVLPLATGDVLLGTRHHGVLIFNGATLLPFRPLLAGINPEALEVTALAAQDSTSFLIGTRNAGVFYAHGGTVLHADAASGLPDNDVESLLARATRAFVGTPLGVAQFELNGPEGQAFHPSRTLAPGLFAHALALAAGALQVGTMDEGVRQVALDAGPRLRHIAIEAPRAEEAGTASQRVDAFLSGELALVDGKLVRRVGASWAEALPAVANTLADGNVSALAFDAQGHLYVGFFDHGLDILTPGSPEAPRHMEDDRLFCVNRLALDPVRHTMAAATANGLVLFDDGGMPRQTLTRRDGLISDHVTDVAFTASGTVVATPAGLTWIGPGGAESLYAFGGLVNNHVYTLGVGAGSGQVVAGTLGGLSVLEDRQVKRNFTATNSALGHNWVTALAPTVPGTYLVGTYGAGLQTLLPSGAFAAIDLPAGTPRDVVINPNALLVTATHTYAGTLGHGMLVYTAATGRWRAITTGLPSLNVTAFAAQAGVVYIGTENGLVRIAEARL